MILRAKCILDERFAGLDNAAVRIAGGRIAEIGSALRMGDPDVRDLGDCIILPGLTNAHTHLELSPTAGRVPPSNDFVDWLRRLRVAVAMLGNDENRLRQSITQGLDHSLSSGVTLIGDITRQPRQVRRAIAGIAVRPAVVSYGEIIAIGRARGAAVERLAAAVDSAWATDDLRIGLSPHAPYSVEPAVLSRCAEVAEQHSLPLCIHAAETKAEEQFTRDLAGPFRSFLEEIGLWDDGVPRPGLRPVEMLHRAGALRPGTLLAHGNYLAEDDFDLLRDRCASVAFCPRTHAAFGHAPHPFQRLLRHGVNVCLGTDSLASNPSLSILEEMRFLRRRHEELPAGTILQMGTQNGAAALGHGHDRGLLNAGRRADLIVIPLEKPGPVDPLENILQGTQFPILVMVSGNCVAGAVCR